MNLYMFSRCTQNNELENTTIMENRLGQCLSMCPETEADLRKKESLVHVLEVINDERILVKCYCRSAADMKMAVPSLLRPYSVLMNTVQYLLLEVTKQSYRVPSTVMYDFLNDRLRAVRQDMTIQRLPPKQCISLLDPMVRFHVYYGYKLCECPIKDYDPILNKKYLLECLKLFLSCCDKIEENKHSQHIMDQITHEIINLDIQDGQKKFKCNRVLMESLYVLCNLNDIHPLYRYLQLPKYLRSNPSLLLSYRIGIENLHKKYVLVNKLSKKLRPLEYCAFTLYLPRLHRESLQIVNTAYSSKQLTVPCDVVKRWLGISSDSQLVDTCRHYGIKLAGDRVCFNKSEFKNDVSELQPRKEFDISTENIFDE